MQVHGLACRVDVHPQTLLEGRVAGAGDETEAGHKVGVGFVVEGVPAELVGDVVQLGGGLLEDGLLVFRRGGGCDEGWVRAGGQDAVQP